MMIKKYTFIVTLLFIAQPIQAIIPEVFIGGVLAGGTVYTAYEAKKEFKKLESNKIFIEQKKQLAKGIQESNLKEIGNGAKGIMWESAKPALLVAYAICTGVLALEIFGDLLSSAVR